MDLARVISETFAKSSTVGTIFIEKNNMITSCNALAANLLHEPKENLLGKNVKQIFPRDMQALFLSKRKKPAIGRIYISDKVLDVELIPLLDHQNRRCAILLIYDVTPKEELLNQLMTTHKIWSKMDDVIESSYDGIYITDGEAVTLRVNKAYERITGLKREEIIGRKTEDLVREGYLSESATVLVLRNKKTNTIQQSFKTGKKALVTSTPIFDSEGSITMVVTNVRDITELYELKEELEEKERLANKYYLEIQEIRKQLLDSEDIIAEDMKMLQVMQTAKKVAPTDVTVILLGETGVGKEEIAKLIYKNGLRKDKPFISINCGAMPESLIEMEMFGYEKGSFTGASETGKIGLFEVADGGTVFLDEVGELSLAVQIKLLRVLQEHEIKRIGGSKPVKVDVRIIAATNRNLEELVRQKKFREDLYYRLNVVPITIPPLRERKQDIIPLLRHFLAEVNNKYKLRKGFGADALKYLYEYDWPGNVRELKNIVERVFVMSAGNIIGKDDLPQHIQHSMSDIRVPYIEDILPLRAAVNRIEEQLIEKAYDKYGNVREAAKALEIDAATYVRKRKKMRERMLQK